MRFLRGVWVGATLLLTLAGCSDDDKQVDNVGSYSPIVTGIAASNEPIARGVPNQLTAQVTNVNNLPLTFSWSIVAANDSQGVYVGDLANANSQTATWTPPDSIAAWKVMVTVEADDPAAGHYSKTFTAILNVDNQYTRWTKSDAVQLDPGPVPGGGVLFSQIRSSATGASDIWRVDTPLAGAVKLTDGFFTATSPTARADKLEFAFAGKTLPNLSGNSIYVLPWGGGDTLAARAVASLRNDLQKLGHPRFGTSGAHLLYLADTVASGYPKPVWRDVTNFGTPPVPLLAPFDFNFFLSSYGPTNWGPDINADGFPDSVVTTYTDTFGQPAGIAKIGTAGNASEQVAWLSEILAETPDWSPDGSHIVFARRNPGTHERDLWIMNRAASSFSDAMRITSGPADDSQPRFSADGSAIFFVSNRVDRYGYSGVLATERRGTNIWSVALFDRP